MKSNIFIHKSRRLIKFWVLVAGVTLSVMLLQICITPLRSKKIIGFAGLINSHIPGWAMAISALIFVFSILANITEISQMYGLIKEYPEFMKSIRKKNDEVKELLYRTKIVLFILIVGSSIWVFAGLGAYFNLIYFLILAGIKAYYSLIFIKLMNFVPRKQEEYVLETQGQE